jgi:hypothetical protein
VLAKDEGQYRKVFNIYWCFPTSESRAKKTGMFIEASIDSRVEMGAYYYGFHGWFNSHS